MRDSGIIEKLYSDFYYNATVLHYIRNHDAGLLTDQQIVLQLKHMSGAFTVLILGCMISLVAFSVEIIMSIYSKRQRARRNWNLLRMAVHQVAIIRSMQKTDKNNTVKWNISKQRQQKKKRNSKMKRIQEQSKEKKSGTFKSKLGF